MSKRIGRVTYERQYVILQVPDEWKTTDPLPEPSPDDQWFDSLSEFEATLNGPYDRRAINRRPPTAPPPSGESTGKTT
jgi:hypothetical protein